MKVVETIIMHRRDPNGSQGEYHKSHRIATAIDCGRCLFFLEYEKSLPDIIQSYKQAHSYKHGNIVLERWRVI